MPPRHLVLLDAKRQTSGRTTSNAAMATVLSAAAPLPPKVRSEFLQAVASELEPAAAWAGVVFRTCLDRSGNISIRELERRQIRVPIIPSSSPVFPKYSGPTA